MDNQVTEPTSSALKVDGAAQAMGAFLEPQAHEKSAQALEKEVLDDLSGRRDRNDTFSEEPVTEDAEQDLYARDDEAVTIVVDGKTVNLSKAELADAYKNGLRQSDYTRKTMEVAEQRKAADAEIQRATQERQEYASNLQKMAAQIEGALNQQQQIDWEHLLDNNPAEYLKQQHLYQRRQAAYQKNIQQQQHLAHIAQAEQAHHLQSVLHTQQEELLAKLPDWKDSRKAEAESNAIRRYLLEQGFEHHLVDSIADHKAVLLGRKAMLYDAMMSKANAAAKRVTSIPQKVVRPGVGESPGGDGRQAAMQRLAKSGRVEDAASLFAKFI